MELGTLTVGPGERAVSLGIDLPSCFGTRSYQPTSSFRNEGTAAGRVSNIGAATFHEKKTLESVHLGDS